MRKCAICQRPFEAKRPQAKYCGETCKKRAQRVPAGIVPIKPAEPVHETASQAHTPGDVAAAVAAELTAAGCESSSLGAQAIQLVRRMTEQADTGSAFAALSLRNSVR
jgi:hypothetical protein